MFCPKQICEIVAEKIRRKAVAVMFYFVNKANKVKGK